MARSKSSALAKVGARGVGAASGLVKTLSDPKKTKRMLTVGKVAAPIVAPIALKGLELARHAVDARRAKQLGVDVDRVAAYRGPTGRTKARIDATAQAVADLRGRRTGDAEVADFANRVDQHLADLASAVAASAPMPGSRRRATIAAVDAELDQIESDLIRHLVRTGA